MFACQAWITVSLLAWKVNSAMVFLAAYVHLQCKNVPGLSVTTTNRLPFAWILHDIIIASSDTELVSILVDYSLCEHLSAHPLGKIVLPSFSLMKIRCLSACFLCLYVISSCSFAIAWHSCIWCLWISVCWPLCLFWSVFRVREDLLIF